VIWTLLLIVPALLLALPGLALLLQVLGARRLARAAAAAPAQPTTWADGPAVDGTVAVLIPAHDEAAGIERTLRQVRAQLRPGDRLLVVADNCSDDTAAIARAAGAEVTERVDRERRGKGWALDHGRNVLRDEARQAPDRAPAWLVILDADCTLQPGCLPRLVRRCAQLGLPVQARYLLHAPDERLKSRVSAFAVRLKNRVRPLGMQALGLPCGLYGSGMALPFALAAQAPLASGHIAEDMQLGLHLAQQGLAPQFCDEAVVDSVLAANAEGAGTQRTRWEHGHLSLLLREGPGMLWRAATAGRWRALGMIADLLIPPLVLTLALQLAGLAALGLLTLAGAPAWIAGLAAVGVAGWVIAVLLARQWFAADLLGWRDLAYAPLYIAGKLPLYLRFLSGRRSGWIRTRRD
jgi:glycosyltransferase involved in cell wall biosynthesis